MGLFGGKSTHERDLTALLNLTGQLIKMTTESEEVGPYLRFERPDSKFRYSLFCLSTVHTACAYQMKNPDAVLNEALYLVLRLCLEEPEEYFGGEIDPQDAANQSTLLQDFLNRWSTYVDITSSGNKQAGQGIVCSMIRECESVEQASSADSERLAFVGSWIMDRTPDAQKVFKTAGGS